MNAEDKKTPGRKPGGKNRLLMRKPGWAMLLAMDLRSLDELKLDVDRVLAIRRGKKIEDATKLAYKQAYQVLKEFGFSLATVNAMTPQELHAINLSTVDAEVALWNALKPLRGKNGKIRESL